MTTITYQIADGRRFKVSAPYYLASCNYCGWVGSSEKCHIQSGDDSDVYCPNCSMPAADCGSVSANSKEVKS